ncbi:alpha/beta fold hydrolase [Paenibacillus thalictri]|uniref:Alpha/beta hydrolase n=1 Tax=Paenibacillus thalictri TaxID=2527873 RepID=A0A4Q9DIY6_9BACL|nr:alpha/beta hydrolase [Paenibacillus thalictri]TBL73299.1 alpha/beta hydrolase [Paenibacillus thalictri]
MPLVQLKDVNIHYRIEGDGPPLVLLHGMGSNSLSWRNQLEQLKSEFTVIAWDAPGYGESSDPAQQITKFEELAEILKQFLDALGFNWVYLLGHSMGSVLALHFYSKYPDMLKALILADGTRGGASGDPEINKNKLMRRLSSIEKLTPQEIAKQRSRELLSEHSTIATQEEAETIYSQIRPAGYLASAYSLYHADFTPFLSTVKVPTLVICGELDQVTPLAESTIIHQGIEGSELAIVPQAGHLSYLEDPATFNKLVSGFIDKLTYKTMKKGV